MFKARYTMTDRTPETCKIACMVVTDHNTIVALTRKGDTVTITPRHILATGNHNMAKWAEDTAELFHMEQF